MVCCCAVRCSNMSQDDHKMNSIPMEEKTERRKNWFHKISRRDFTLRRAYLCECVNMEYLPHGYTYHIEGDCVKVKEISSEENVEDWIKELSRLSLVTWKVARTFPKSHPGRIYYFKKDFRCHHNTRTANTGEDSGRRSKNTNCPAVMKIRIKRYDKEWPTYVQFSGNHNHSLTAAAALKYRPIAPEVIAEIQELFQRGHTPSTAYTTYCTNKMEELGDIYFDKCGDREIFPTKDDIQNIWKKDFKEKYGERSGKEMLCSLGERLDELKIQGCKTALFVQDQMYVVGLCTPTMQRAQTLKLAEEIIFVDATANCDIQNHRIYFVTTFFGAVGGIPLACIITNSLKSDMFDEGLRILLEEFKLFEKPPGIIITDDDLNERRVLKKHFPTAKMYLCIFHVLKACWQWLLRKDHVKKDRQALYFLFKNVLYCETEKEFQEKVEELQAASENYPPFKAYIGKLLERKEEWALCYRREIVTRSNNTNNSIEVIFRLLKDIPLERTKAFNLNQLVDFIANSFETYFIKRLVDTAHRRVNLKTLRRYAPDCSEIDQDSVQHIEGDIFTVRSCHSTEIYNVDMSVGICTCVVGRSGKICKHQMAVISKHNIFSPLNALATGTQKVLFWIATGKEKEDNYFEPLVSVSSMQNIENTNTEPENLVNRNSEPNFSLFEIEQSAMNMDTHATEQSATEMDKHALSSVGNIEEGLQKIDAICKKLKEEIQNDPENMLPAVGKFFEKFQKSAINSVKLASALHTGFSSMTSRPLSTKKTVRKGRYIPVQPTAVARRTKQLSGKRKYIGGRVPGPTWKGALKHHNYTTLGHIPSKKLKRPHSLSDCVSKNVSLGKTNEKK